MPTMSTMSVGMTFAESMLGMVSQLYSLYMYYRSAPINEPH